MTAFDPARFVAVGNARSDDLVAIAGGSEAATVVTPAQVIGALREVFDPELGMSIVELGLVYGIDVRGSAVTVTMTLTAPGCPIHDAMSAWVKEAVAKVLGVEPRRRDDHLRPALDS